MISKEAIMIEKIMSFMGMRKIISRMMINPKHNNSYDKPPKKFYNKYDIECNTISGSKCFSLKSSDKPNKHILYFHGGAYTMQAKRIHWNITEEILRRTSSEVTFINYPLAPEYTCEDTIYMVREAYSLLCSTSKQEIILMGDSAGGGLSLAFAQYIESEGIRPKPSKLILFSPWLDVSMNHEISEKQQENDLILDKDTLATVGQWYAGGLDTKHYLCSPLYGDMKDVGEIMLFTGTKEILNTQAKMLRDKLKSISKSLHYFEYENMQHVWIGFPIPEAKDAMDRAICFIEKTTL